MISTVQELRNSLAALLAHDRIIHQQIEAHYNVLKTLGMKDEDIFTKEAPDPVRSVRAVSSPPLITAHGLDKRGHKRRGSPIQKAVLKILLKEGGPVPMFVLLKVGNKHACRSAVYSLEQQGLIKRADRGYYELAQVPA